MSKQKLLDGMIWMVPRFSNSGKWSFSSGSPTKNIKILVTRWLLIVTRFLRPNPIVREGITCIKGRKYMGNWGCNPTYRGYNPLVTGDGAHLVIGTIGRPLQLPFLTVWVPRRSKKGRQTVWREEGIKSWRSRIFFKKRSKCKWCDNGRRFSYNGRKQKPRSSDAPLPPSKSTEVMKVCRVRKTPWLKMFHVSFWVVRSQHPGGWRWSQFIDVLEQKKPASKFRTNEKNTPDPQVHPRGRGHCICT